MQDKVNRLLRVRKELKEIEDTAQKLSEPLKVERDKLQTEITEWLNGQGVLSTRFQNATVIKSVKKTVQVLNETEAVAALKEKGLTDYYSERLTDLFWDSAAKEIAKEGKCEIPGLTIQEKEFLSVRPSEKEERRKVTVD